jgi:putative sterol carrier protein
MRNTKAEVEAILRSLPARLRTDRVEGYRGTFHFDVKDAAKPHWTVDIENSACTVQEGFLGTPTCVVTMDEETFLKIETGAQNPIMAFVKGRIKVTNVGQMRRYDRAFYRFHDAADGDEARTSQGAHDGEPRVS